MDKKTQKSNFSIEVSKIKPGVIINTNNQIEFEKLENKQIEHSEHLGHSENCNAQKFKSLQTIQINTISNVAEENFVLNSENVQNDFLFLNNQEKIENNMNLDSNTELISKIKRSKLFKKFLESKANNNQQKKLQKDEIKQFSSSLVSNNEINLKNINSKIFRRIILLKSRSFPNLQETSLLSNNLSETSKHETPINQTINFKSKNQIIGIDRSSSTDHKKCKGKKIYIENRNNDTSNYIKINENGEIDYPKDIKLLKSSFENNDLSKEQKGYSEIVRTNDQDKSNNKNNNKKREYCGDQYNLETSNYHEDAKIKGELNYTENYNQFDSHINGNLRIIDSKLATNFNKNIASEINTASFNFKNNSNNHLDKEIYIKKSTDLLIHDLNKETEENVRLKKELQEALNKNTILAEKICFIEKEKEGLDQLLNSLNKEKIEIKIKNTQKENEILVLAANFEELKKKYTFAENQIEILNQNHSKLLNEITFSQNHINFSNLKEENMKLKNLNETMKNEFDKTKNELFEMKNQFSQKNSFLHSNQNNLHECALSDLSIQKSKEMLSSENENTISKPEFQSQFQFQPKLGEKLKHELNNLIQQNWEYEKKQISDASNIDSLKNINNQLKLQIQALTYKLLCSQDSNKQLALEINDMKQNEKPVTKSFLESLNSTKTKPQLPSTNYYISNLESKNFECFQENAKIVKSPEFSSAILNKNSSHINQLEKIQFQNRERDKQNIIIDPNREQKIEIETTNILGENNYNNHEKQIQNKNLEKTIFSIQSKKKEEGNLNEFESQLKPLN